MLQALHIAYDPGPLSGPLFEDLSLSLDVGEIVCLTGPNGAGKTALIEILASLRKPGKGQVVLKSGATLSYVRQDVDPNISGSLAAHLLQELMDEEERAHLCKAMARLGLPPSRLDDPASSFSIEERVRAEIARAVVDDPDVLLLDEPTNHLDLEGKTWIVRLLQDWPGACLMVCHDRAVIDEVADRTLILERGVLSDFAGGFSDALAMKTQLAQNAREAYEKSRSEQRRLKIAAEKTLQKAATMSKRPTGRTYDPKAKAFYGGLQAKLDRRAVAIKHRVEHVAEQQVEKPFEPDRVAMRFSAAPLRSSTVTTVRGLRLAFGSRELYGGLNLTLMRGDRIALVGPNGSGKTTLMRLLLGEIEPDSGEIEIANGIIPAYLTQGRERLNDESSLLDAIDGEPDSVRTFLGCLGLRYHAAEKPVGVLSVGERTKAELVALLCSPANLLLLDEPTNHLDIPALEALEEALLEFPGSIVFASHDQMFVERVATEIVKL